MERDVTQIIASNLKRRRRELNMTQSQLAKRLQYSEKAVSKWESGKGAPPTTLLPLLASILETTPNGLLFAPSAQTLYLGIDGGGTKTEFLLANEQGEILRRVLLGASNPNDIGFAQTQEILRQGILSCCGEYPLGCISVYAGLAGGSTGSNAEAICKFLTQFGFLSVKNGSDATNAVSAALGREDGVIVIMGTGSIAFAQSNGVQHRLGGFGYLLGDGGSGFAMGREVILAALRQEDGSGPKTHLHTLVKQKCGSNTVLEKVGDFYRGGKTLIASFAPLLFEAVATGDAVATSILKHQLREIATLITGAIGHIEADTIPVVLCGGLAQANHQWILPTLQALLENAPRHCKLSVCETSMTVGALYLAGMPQAKKETIC